MRMAHRFTWLAVVALCLASVAPGSSQAPARCPRCGWAPPAARDVVRVRNVEDLQRAVHQAPAGATVLIAKGRYRLQRTLEITVPRLTLRGETGQRDDVVLVGGGMKGDTVGVAIGVTAPDVTLADFSVGMVGYHGIQVRGETGADRVTVHDVRVFDTGQQLLKGSCTKDFHGANDGIVACSLFEYTDTAPSDYTNGIDVLGARGWTVRDNTFRRIRGPESGSYAAGPAILFWRRSAGTTVERNLVVDSFRGIALGLVPEAEGDHVAGVVRNNVVCNLNAWADEGIEVNSAPNVEIDHNTVLHAGHLFWSISVRFQGTFARVRNNLTNKAVLQRTGGLSAVAGNVTTAAPEWFVDAAGSNLRLRSDASLAIARGMMLPSVTTDFDHRPRPADTPPDVGAFQYTGAPGTDMAQAQRPRRR